MNSSLNDFSISFNVIRRLSTFPLITDTMFAVSWLYADEELTVLRFVSNFIRFGINEIKLVKTGKAVASLSRQTRYTLLK